MSQPSVERFLGRLVTDEAFRRRFWSDPAGVLEEQHAAGLVLNPCERRSLLALHHHPVERFAAALDPCIQKVAASAPATESAGPHAEGESTGAAGSAAASSAP